MKDILEQMIEDAGRLQKTYYNEDQALMHRLGTGCMVNLSQAMDLDWKMAGNPNPKKSREKLMGLVDAFHYILSMLSQSGKDPSNLREILVARRIMIEDLHLSFKKLTDFLSDPLFTEKKVAVVDIDNIIYPYTFIWESFKHIHGVPDKMSRAECKDLYRSSGLKSIVPPIKDSNKVLELLHEKGYVVILLSAREVNLYPEVYVDTIDFLKNYDLYHDFLLFKKEKRGGGFTDIILNKADIFIDDTVEQMTYSANYSIKYRFLVTQESYEIESHIIPMGSMTGLLNHLTENIDEM